MLKDQDILEQFALSVINVRTVVGQVCVLVLKSNGEIFIMIHMARRGSTRQLQSNQMMGLILYGGYLNHSLP